METIIKNEYRGANKIVQAYSDNKLGVILDSSLNNPYRLQRFKNKYKVQATGKEINNQYLIVFWDKLKQQINVDTQ